MKVPFEEPLQRIQRQGIILGFTVVFFAGATLIVERNKLRDVLERNFSFEKKEAKPDKAISESDFAEIPLCK